MPEVPPLPGVRLARGVSRLLRELDFAPLPEFILPSGLRADVLALGPRGEIWLVECKSCRGDFAGDRKWQGYLEWCDRFFWAVDADFPSEILPPDAGLVLADWYGAEILRLPAATPLAASRRAALVRRFARAAAGRLAATLDPPPGRGGMTLSEAG